VWFTRFTEKLKVDYRGNGLRYTSSYKGHRSQVIPLIGQALAQFPTGNVTKY